MGTDLSGAEELANDLMATQSREGLGADELARFGGHHYANLCALLDQPAAEIGGLVGGNAS
jgi:hypothetical protein